MCRRSLRPTRFAIILVFGVLAVKLRTRVEGPYLGSVMKSSLVMLFLSVAMGSFCIGIWFIMEKRLAGMAGLKYFSLLIPLIAGGVFYLFVSKLFRMRELTYLFTNLRKKPE